VEWYHDPLPTNCVADWVCPAGTGAGYPQYAYAPGPEHEYKNLAVFYQACTFNCLFCQNYHFRQVSPFFPKKTSDQLADAVDSSTACICYFGGDPTPQLPHALAASREAIKRNPRRILRICWETNGSMHRSLLKQMLDLSMDSGGCIKFDLKAFDEQLHLALCGVNNRQTLENFQWLGQFTVKRVDPPLVIASTLLIPGYVDEEEVMKIARFIASIDPSIPYSLLGFYPQFQMDDLPVTTRAHAEACRTVALEEGLERVHLGNVHLLG
jgi:pyruvate formate lyase activating enzyme